MGIDSKETGTGTYRKSSQGKVGLIQTFKGSTIVKAVNNSKICDVVLKILTLVEQELFSYADRYLLQYVD